MYKNITDFQTIQEYINDKVQLDYPNVTLVRENYTVNYLYENDYDPYGGHEYVDFGLQSGTLWATMNVGAEQEEDAGLYFAWGDAVGYTPDDTTQGSHFNWEDYVYSTSSTPTLTKYYSTDQLVQLEDIDDAAVQKWGGLWHMPTRDQFLELNNATNKSWETSYNGSGIKGLLLTSKTDSSKTLFFPAAGHCVASGATNKLNDYNKMGVYWSSTVSDTDWSNGRRLQFSSASSYNFNGQAKRYYGHSVRPVASKLQS